jgi:hypothetical protein
MWEKKLGNFLKYKYLMKLQNQFQLQSEIKIVNLQSKSNENNTSNRYYRRKMCSPKGITTPRLFIMKIRLRLLKSLRHTESNICI